MLKSIINTFFTRGSIAILNLVILLVSSRNLGSEVMGRVNLLILNIAIIQIINEIYTGYALVHYIPLRPLRDLFKNGLLWTICCVTGLNLVFYLVDTLVMDIYEQELFFHCFFLSGIIILNSFNCVLILGKEKIKRYNLILLVQPVILCAVIVLSVLSDDTHSVYTYIYALYPAVTLPLIISLWTVLKLVRNDTTTHKSEGKVFATGFLNQLGNLAHTLSNRFNYYMISSFALLGVYSNATSLIESVWLIGNSFAPIVLTRVANSDDYGAYAKTVLICSKISLFLSTLIVLLIVILPEAFFTFFLGPDFVGVKAIMLVLSPGILCISFSIIISHYFSGRGIQKVQLWANYSGLLVTLTLSHIMIGRYGVIGAAYVATASYFTQALVLSVVFFKKNGFSFFKLFSLKDLRILDQLRKIKP